MKELAHIRKNEFHLMPYLRPDSKAQLTMAYDDKNVPLYVHTVVISTQHDDFDTEEAMLERISKDIKTILLPRVIPTRLLNEKTIYHVNPTGKIRYRRTSR